MFDLEKDAGWMSWSVWNPSTQLYETKLAYHTSADTSIATHGEGLYFDCPSYVLDDLRLEKKLVFADDTYIRNNGSNGLYFQYEKLFYLRMNTATSNWVDAFWIDVLERGKCELHSGGRLNMGNFSIINQSDCRLKTNIKNVDFEAVELLNAIDIKSYDWVKTMEHESAGVIAQQLEMVIPDLVEVDNKTGVKSLKMLQFIPYLIKAIQEISERVYEKQWEKATWEDVLSDQDKYTFLIETEKQKSPKTMRNDTNRRNGNE